MPIEYEPSDKNIVCRYKNGVKLVLDFLPEPFGNRDRTTSRGWAPALSGSSVTKAGSRPATAARSWSSLSRSQKELPETSKRVHGLDVSAHARNFFDCIRTPATRRPPIPT